jgi:hypothetical protein
VNTFAETVLSDHDLRARSPVMAGNGPLGGACFRASNTMHLTHNEAGKLGDTERLERCRD